MQWPREVIRTDQDSAPAGKRPEKELGESVEGIRRVRSLTDIVIVEEKEKEALIVQQAQQRLANQARQDVHAPVEALHPPSPAPLRTRASELADSEQEGEAAPPESPTTLLAKRVQELSAEEEALADSPTNGGGVGTDE